jgi:uncharacterized protein
MHRTIVGLIFALITFAGLSFSGAFEVPTLTDSVVDRAGLLESSTQQKLANALKVIHDKGGPQLAVLTVDTIDGLTIEEASIQVAQAWKLGTEQKDNGILLMVAKSERKIRIEVGQGVEGDLTDAYSRRIIDDTMVPLFRKGYTSDGILLGVSEILKRMDPPYDLAEFLEIPTRVSSRSGKQDWGKLILMLAIFLFLMFANGGGRGMNGGMRGGFSGAMMGGLMGGGFGGHSGGGGWSGGGGGFSGGGASGSW